jgi:spermidine synthase
MIICLAPPPENAMLNRFYTKEFFSMCRDHLQPGGIFFTSIYGFSNYLSPVLKKYIASIYKSFREIFPYSLNTSGETIYLMGAAESGVIPENCRDLISGYKDKFASLQKYNLEKEIIENFDAQEFRMLFEESQLEYFKKKIENSIPDADANLDLKPKAYWNKILLSAYQEESVIYDLLNKYYLLPLVVLFITFFVFYDIRKAYGDERVASAFTIFVIGFTSISTLILLIILFQNYYGILFYRISLINALFMLGLASGSYFANRFEIKILSSFLLSLSGMLFVLIIYTVYNNEYLFWGIILFYSFLCGTVFPLLFKNISGKDYHKTASLLNALENYGSVTGSLLTAVFLVPVIGIIGTIYVNMGLLFAGAIAVRRRADCL